MGEIKGTGVAAALKFIEKNYSQEVLKTVLDSLNENDKKLFSSTIFSYSWYPLSSFANLLKAIKGILGEKDPAVLRKTGKFSAEYGLKTVYKLFFRFGSPQFILSKASSLWDRYWSTGKLEVIQSDKNSAFLHLVDFDTPSTEICERIMGWIEGAFILIGCKDVVLKETLCRTHGDAYCRYEIKWE